jgi:hypothetical protein
LKSEETTGLLRWTIGEAPHKAIRRLGCRSRRPGTQVRNAGLNDLGNTYYPVQSEVEVLQVISMEPN